MDCMKCGNKVEAGESFCPSCLANMARYPVKPETVIQLPQQQPEPKRAAPRRRGPTDGERIARLKMGNRILSYSLILAVLVICLLGYGTRVLLDKLEDSQNLGKNYSTVDTTSPAGPRSR